MMLPYEFKDLVGRDYKTHHRMMPRDDDDDGDEFEHSDLEAHAMDATLRTMYPIHQFIAPDEARDSMGSDDSEQDAAHNDAAMRSKILSAETFDSEDTPCRMMPEDDDDGDEFEHGDLEAHALDANTADNSIHQFIARIVSFRPGEQVAPAPSVVAVFACW